VGGVHCWWWVAGVRWRRCGDDGVVGGIGGGSRRVLMGVDCRVGVVVVVGAVGGRRGGSWRVLVGGGVAVEGSGRLERRRMCELFDLTEKKSTYVQRRKKSRFKK
jgi:L-aminopeptidase/D-esterase-like protein